MDNNLVSRSLQESAAVKKCKSKKKKKKSNKKQPIKVVYISNPIEVKTSASKFRALVQELTGQDAEYPVVQTKLMTDTDTDGQTVPDALKKCTDDDDDDNQQAQEVPKVEEPPPPAGTGGHDSISFDNSDDDVFTPQMLENFTGFMPSGYLL